MRVPFATIHINPDLTPAPGYFGPKPASAAEKRVAAAIFRNLYGGDLYRSGEGHHDAMEWVARRALTGRLGGLDLTPEATAAIDAALASETASN